MKHPLCVTNDLFVAESQYCITVCLQPFRALCVPCLLSGQAVIATVNLYDKSGRKAYEVCYILSNDMLSFERLSQLATS